MPVTAPMSTTTEPPSSPVVGQIEDFLYHFLTPQIRTEATHLAQHPGRPRTLTALALWGAVLVTVLRRGGSQLAIWRELAGFGLWSFPPLDITDQAVYNRLDRGGTTPLADLFTRITAVLARRLTPYADAALVPFAADVVAIDETTLDQIGRHLPGLRDQPDGADALLPGKLAAVFDLRRRLCRRVLHHENPHQNEKAEARSLLDGLVRGTLILADLGYFGFKWFDDLTDAGYWWVSRLREKTSYTVITTYYETAELFDGLVWLGVYRSDLAKYAVRLVQYTINDVTYTYITNVRSPHDLSAADIARLYARRWDIELWFKLVKRELHLSYIWSAKPVVILQQVWAVFIIGNILQALHLEIAGQAGVTPDEVSVALLCRYLPRFAAAGQDPVAEVVAHGRRLHFIRPSRRVALVVPEVPPDAIEPLPPGLTLVRTPRYGFELAKQRAAERQLTKDTS